MYRTSLLLVLLAVVGCAGVGRSSIGTSGLACVIKAGDFYKPEEPTVVSWTLLNGTDKRVHVLKWYTPLEDINGILMGNCFRVEKDGKEVDYIGILAKRGDPSRKDYVTVEPWGSVCVVIDLAQSYDLSAPGAYEVTFVGGLLSGGLCDIIWNGEDRIPLPMRSHRPLALRCNTITIWPFEEEE